MLNQGSQTNQGYRSRLFQIFCFAIFVFWLGLKPVLAQEEITISSIVGSSSAPGFPATKAIDQDLTTFWQGQSKKRTWWLRLDLGKTSSLNKLSIFWHKDSGSTNYGLQGSNDAMRWKKLSVNLSSSEGTTNPHLKEHGLSGSYRYLRILIFKAQKGSPIIYELKVLGQIPASDIIPPTGSIRINNNASYANSTSVVLSLSARDNPGGSGLSQMQFSNDGISWSAPEAYAATKSWSLSPGDGQKMVSVKFKDNAGNWSQVYSDTITLDTIPPQIISLNPQDGSTFDENDMVLIFPTVNDIDSSPLEYQFSVDGTIKQPWSARSSYSWNATPERHSLKIEVKDTGGQDSRESEIYIFRKPLIPADN